MANVLSPVKLKNNPTREGFDLSSKRNFTAKVGELLPVWHKFVLPGDTINIDLKSFSRTKPLNTAAFARLREYYDFYFVPLDLLWNRSSEVISQMLANKTHANGRLYSDNISYSGDLPYVTTLDLAKFCTSATGSNKANLFGFNTADVTAKLFQYLGYGNFYKLARRETMATSITGTNLQQSLFPALAYQKIYNDFFRYQQWENSQPWTFNVDFMKGTNDLNFFNGYDFASQQLFTSSNPFTLRYVNYQKDLFRGILPRAQYGDTSTVNINNDDTSFRVYNKFNKGLMEGMFLRTEKSVTGVQPTEVVAVPSTGGSASNLFLNTHILKSSFSILALRQAQALQKWKEISIANNEDVAAQIEAHWGVDVSQYLSDKCRWLGGTSANLDINEVTNTNLADSNAANLAGKGIISNGSQINFTSKAEYGIIMCVYHAEPIVDYVTTGVDLNNTIVSATDFPIPEFDRIGMEVLQKEYLINPIDSSENITVFKNIPGSLGYVPRYVRWKTDIDRSYGDFSESLRSWILPFSDSDVVTQLRDATNSIDDSENNPDVPINPDANFDVTYAFFKVNPHVVDDLFVVASDSTVQTDQLEISSYFDAKFVRNLDRNGLPY